VRPGRRTQALAGAAILLWGVVVPACVRPSEEARIRGVLKEALARAEKRDPAALMELFAPDYRDFQGRDSDGTLRLVTDYLDRYNGVVLHLLGARVGEPGTDGLVTVECEIVMSHGAAEVLRKLIRFTGEYYRFRIDLRKTEAAAWRFVYAEWESIGLGELFPESSEILRKLFPGL
jgi:hypothetical protein